MIIGRGVRSIFDEVLRARVAYVVSPWIQEPYASALLKMVMEGRARVVTSMDRENAFYKLLVKTHVISIAVMAIAGLAVAFSLFALLLTALLIPSILIIAVPIFIAWLITGITLLRLLEFKPPTNVKLSPPPKEYGFVHVKLYIADDRAWIGSANMTTSAWKRNIEVLVPIDVKTAVCIFKQIWKLIGN